jgi:hypothetical protein
MEEGRRVKLHHACASKQICLIYLLAYKIHNRAVDYHAYMSCNNCKQTHQAVRRKQKVFCKMQKHSTDKQVKKNCSKHLQVNNFA